MTVVKEGINDNFSVLENVTTAEGARTIAVNRLTHHIYLPSASFEPPADGKKAIIIPGTFELLDLWPDKGN